MSLINGELPAQTSAWQEQILLVDDNPQNLKVLYETLDGRGYKLLVADHGEKALNIAQKSHPDLILLDIMMPEMDGYEVCERLKANPATREISVIFLSALEDTDSKVRAFDAGGVDYIAKPFQIREVIARVETHLTIQRLKKELQERNRALQIDKERILNAMGEGIYGLDAQGRIVFANPAAQTISGYAEQELVGQDFVSLHFAGSEPEVCQQLHDAVVSGQSLRIPQLLMAQPGDAQVPVDLSVSPTQVDDERQGAVVVFRDIREDLERQAELELARRKMEEQKSQLAQFSRLSTMGEMAAGIAHELNQPLTAVSNYAQVAGRLLKADPIDRETMGSTLEKIERQAHRASEVLRRIRGFIRKHASGKERLSVDVLLRETQLLAQLDSAYPTDMVRLKVAPNLPPVCVDPVAIQQVALNLIRNGLEAQADRPIDEQFLGLEADLVSDQFVEVRVIDRGTGLSPEVAQHLFSPFVTTKADGMGIGLSLCHSIMQSQGGQIGHRPNPDGGSIFFFTLPVSQPSEA